MIFKILVSATLILESLITLPFEILGSRDFQIRSRLFSNLYEYFENQGKKPDLTIKLQEAKPVLNPESPKSSKKTSPSGNVIRDQKLSPDSLKENQALLNSLALGEATVTHLFLDFAPSRIPSFPPLSSSSISNFNPELSANIGSVNTEVPQISNPASSSGLSPADNPVSPGVKLGDFIINEIMYDLEGSDTVDSKSREWVEIYNNSGRAITLVGGTKEGSFRFNDGSNHLLSENAILGSMTISQGGYFALAGDANIFLSDHPGFPGILIDTVMSLNNTSDTISFIGPDGLKIDEVSYQKSLGAGGNGKTLERISPGSNNWQESSVLGGSPGAVNSAIRP